MSTNGNLLTSPVGEIQFMAVNRPVANKKTGEERREISLLLDSEAASEFIAAVSAINSGIPVTEHTYRGKNKELKASLKGKTKITAGTKYEVAVYDSKGNKMEEAPNFFAESTGTAQMVVQPYTKSEKGGSINLVAVIIHNIEGGTTELTPEERRQKLAELRDLAVKHAVGG